MYWIFFVLFCLDRFLMWNKKENEAGSEFANLGTTRSLTRARLICFQTSVNLALKLRASLSTANQVLRAASPGDAGGRWLSGCHGYAGETAMTTLAPPPPPFWPVSVSLRWILLEGSLDRFGLRFRSGFGFPIRIIHTPRFINLFFFSTSKFLLIHFFVQNSFSVEIWSESQPKDFPYRIGLRFSDLWKCVAIPRWFQDAGDSADVVDAFQRLFLTSWCGISGDSQRVLMQHETSRKNGGPNSWKDSRDSLRDSLDAIESDIDHCGEIAKKCTWWPATYPWRHWHTDTHRHTPTHTHKRKNAESMQISAPRPTNRLHM